MGTYGVLYRVNLLSADAHPHQKIVRYPFTDAEPEVLAKMQSGFLVKFDATANGVLPALAADDALLGGIIVDVPNDPVNPSDTTVAVAVEGSFNQRQIHYANAWSESPPSALSAAAIERLHDIGIFLDPSVPAGEFLP